MSYQPFQNLPNKIEITSSIRFLIAQNQVVSQLQGVCGTLLRLTSEKDPRRVSPTFKPSQNDLDVDGRGFVSKNGRV